MEKKEKPGKHLRGRKVSPVAMIVVDAMVREQPDITAHAIWRMLQDAGIHIAQKSVYRRLVTVHGRAPNTQLSPLQKKRQGGRYPYTIGVSIDEEMALAVFNAANESNMSVAQVFRDAMTAYITSKR
jgi:hypothetical protein